MDAGQATIKVDRCELTGEEYLRLSTPSLTAEYLMGLGMDELKEIVTLMLKEHGHFVFPSDKDLNQFSGAFILESHKSEKRKWSVKSWSLYCCIRQSEPVNAELIEGFYKMVLSDGAESGTVITSGKFSPDARHLGQEKEIELIDGEVFVKMVKEASSPGPYSRQCMAVHDDVRNAIVELKETLRSLGKSTDRSTGSWASPLHIDRALRELVAGILELYANPNDPKAKGVEQELLAKIVEVSTAIKKVESLFKSLDDTMERLRIHTGPGMPDETGR